MFDISKYVSTVTYWATEGMDWVYGGYALGIYISETSPNSAYFEFSYLQGAPSSRNAVASAEISLSEITSNEVTFGFENDGWGHSGNIRLTFSDDSISFAVSDVAYTDSTFPEMWGFYDTSGILVSNPTIYDDLYYTQEEYDALFGEPDYAPQEPVYDTSRASGILASLGMTEQEFRDSCFEMVFYSANLSVRDYQVNGCEMLSYVEYSSVENYGRGDRVMMQIRNMEILRYIEQHNKAKCYQPGQIIFAQGNPANEFFYLKRGLAHVYTLTENGGERNIMIAWPGRFFGASTFFSARNRQSSAIALKESEVLWIDRSLYLACVERFPEFQQLLLEELSEDLTVMFEQLADSSLLEADVKVARFICRRLSASRQTEGAAPIVAYTQEVIADVLGLSRWSVNRVLSKFKENGWLRIERGKIVILEAEAIRRFAYETAGG